MAALSSSLIRFSHLHPLVLSSTVKRSLRPPGATPPDSSAASGDSSATPSPETKPNNSLPAYLDELNYNTKGKKKKKKDKTVIRRDPVQIGARKAREETKEKEEEKSENETAFILAWLGLGSLILVEGIALAASGFLPEEWDNFFVKYIYPSFTPTVLLFVGGSVAYGVIKYLEAEKMKKS